MIHFLLLVLCAVAIYASCTWFVNAVEWLGARLGVGTLSVGSVLAAIGSALPESVVTLVAVAFGRDVGQRQIGIGAAMGAPLVLSTVAYAVAGLAALCWRRRDRGGWSRLSFLAVDQAWFLAIFAFATLLGLVTFPGKPWCGLIFLAGYCGYLRRELRHGRLAGAAEEPERLKLLPNATSVPNSAILVQAIGSLAAIFFASQFFVGQLDAVAPMLGLPGEVTALLLAPIATELPEIMSAIIWVRQGKPALALANIAGAMMIQCTVPSGLAIAFTPWRFSPALISSAIVTMLAVGYLLVISRYCQLTPRLLAAGVVFYVFFAISLVPILR